MTTTPRFPNPFSRGDAQHSGDPVERAFLEAHPLASELVGDAWIDYRAQWRQQFERLATRDASPRGVAARTVRAASRFGAHLAGASSLAVFAVTAVLWWMGPDQASRVLQALAVLLAGDTGLLINQLAVLAGLLMVGWLVARTASTLGPPDLSLAEKMRHWAEDYWLRRCGVEMTYRPVEQIGGPRDPSWDEPRPRWSEEALRGWGPEAADYPHRYLVSYVYAWDSPEGTQRSCSVVVALGQPIHAFADIAAITDRIETSYGRHGRRAYVVVTGWTPFEAPPPPPKAREPLPTPSQMLCTVVDLELRRRRAG